MSASMTSIRRLQTSTLDRNYRKFLEFRRGGLSRREAIQKSHIPMSQIRARDARYRREIERMNAERQLLADDVPADGVPGPITDAGRVA